LLRHKKKPPKWYIGSPVLFCDEDTPVPAVRSPGFSQMPDRTDSLVCAGNREKAVLSYGLPDAYVSGNPECASLPAAWIITALKILIALKSSNG
jgi:hypothetical protein